MLLFVSPKYIFILLKKTKEYLINLQLNNLQSKALINLIGNFKIFNIMYFVCFIHFAIIFNNFYKHFHKSLRFLFFCPMLT